MTDAKSAISGFSERRADVRGCSLRYLVGGAGPPLVLLHGLGGSATNWCELAPLLAERRSVLAPDLPGHGLSTPLPAVAGFGGFADRLAALAEREGMLPAPVVGHSLGGLVALRWAIRRPGDVTALVLAAAAGLSLGGARGRALLAAIMVVRPGRLAARNRDRIARSPALRRLVFGPLMAADPLGLTETAIEGFLGAQLLHTDVRSAWRALVRDDPRLELERVRAPTLVLWGAEDAQLPLDDAFEYARRLRAPLRTIADCGHLLIGERPGACADAILGFLDG